MRLTCPCCGATLSLEALLNDVAARQAVATALALPANLGPRLLRYLGLFRPEKRSLTWDRAASLLNELHTLIAAGSIRRNGRDWPAPPAVWISALDAVLERQNLTLPLKSHGYLLEIIAGQANRTEAAQEEQREEQRRHPPRETSGGMQAISALLAGTLSPHPSPVSGRGEREARGEGASPPPPKRTPPPAEFRHLAARLRGHRNPEPEPTPEPDHD